MALLKEAKTHLFDWIAKTLLGVITWFAIDTHNKVDELYKQQPAMQQQIKSLEEQSSRLNNKVFAFDLQPFFSRKSDELNYTFLNKKKQQ